MKLTEFSQQKAQFRDKAEDENSELFPGSLTRNMKAS
jgi:hypothetical protein